MYVYISGGAGRQSVYDPVTGARLTKDMIRRLLRPYGVVVQTSPNQSTRIIVVPDGVSRASYTSSRKTDMSRVQIMQWTPFYRRYIGRRSTGVRKAKSKSSTKRRRRQPVYNRPGLPVGYGSICVRCGGAVAETE